MSNELTYRELYRGKSEQVMRFSEQITELEKQLAEKDAAARKMMEALKELSLPPYKDSDLKSLIEWMNARSGAALAEAEKVFGGVG